MERREEFLGGKDRPREEAGRQGAIGVEKGQDGERSTGQAAEREIKAQERHRIEQEDRMEREHNPT